MSAGPVDPSRPRVGFSLLLPELVALDPPGRRRLLAAIADAGFDHVGVGDHISFHDGTGFDGLILAQAVLASHDRLPVQLGLYQLALRHPVLVARQLATLAELAPGRLVFGVGVGGDDRAEVEMCGVDPTTRGRRMDEALVVLRQLLTGKAVTFSGEFFSVHDAVVGPAPEPPIPIVIGGRSDAALRRAGRLGDGWLGIWISPRRFAAACAEVEAAAEEAGRGPVRWRHGVNVWCGIGPDRDTARAALAADMESLYRLPAERFAAWCPAGPPAEVADFVAPYLAAGASDITLVARGPSLLEAVAGAGEVRRRLLGS